MNWLVVWTCILTTMGSCPDRIEPDPYTGQLPMTYTSCAVLHLNREKTVKYKTFAKMEDAQAFIKNAPDGIKKHMHLLNIQDE